MPNWCNGPLKIRGKIENVLMYMNENIGGYKFFMNKFDELEFEILELESKPENCTNPLWRPVMKGAFLNSRRCYSQSEPSGWDIEQDGILYVIFPDVECAWAFDVEGFSALSKQYEIDFKFYGYEKGMEYNMEVEISNGEIIKCDEIKFQNYFWECREPLSGG